MPPKGTANENTHSLTTNANISKNRSPRGLGVVASSEEFRRFVCLSSASRNGSNHILASRSSRSIIHNRSADGILGLVDVDHKTSVRQEINRARIDPE